MSPNVSRIGLKNGRPPKTPLVITEEDEEPTEDSNSKSIANPHYFTVCTDKHITGIDSDPSGSIEVIEVVSNETNDETSDAMVEDGPDHENTPNSGYVSSQKSHASI